MNIREQAHREATRGEIDSIAGRLQDILGQQITAFAVGVKDPRLIGKYARGENKPASQTDVRLRRLYVITQILTTRETAETVRAWMVGSHPLLEDRAPVELLHEDNVDPVERTAEANSAPVQILPSDGYRRVVNAAEDFLVSA